MKITRQVLHHYSGSTSLHRSLPGKLYRLNFMTCNVCGYGTIPYGNVDMGDGGEQRYEQTFVHGPLVDAYFR